MKFNEMKYERPDFDLVYGQMKALLGKMENAETEAAFFTAYDDLEDLSIHLETMGTLAYVRHTIDTKDEFYLAEQDIFDVEGPRFQEISSEGARISLTSKFRDRIEEKFGKHLLEKFEVEYDEKHLFEWIAE